MTIRTTTLHRYFFYILLLLLPTQLGFHFWPEWSHVLGRRIDYLSPTLYFTDILILLTLSTWAYGLIARNLNHDLGIMNHGKNNTIIHASLFILLFICINSATSHSPALSLYYWLKAVEFGLLCLYIVKTKPPLHMIQNSLCIAVLYSSLLAIIQFYLQHSIGGPVWFLGERTFFGNTPGIAQIPLFLNLGFWKLDFGLVLRSYGTFSHPNVLGGFLAVTMPLLLRDFQFSISRWKSNAFNTGVIFLGITALLLTFSRSAWIVFLFGLLFSGKKKQLLIVVVFCALCGIGYSFSSLDESVIVRQQLMNSSIDIWKSHPWFGVGLGNFLVALPSFLPSKFIYFLQPVHNIYLLLLSELGVIGFAVIIFFVWKLRNKIHLSWPIIAILLLGVVDHYPLTLQQGQLMLALSVGLLFL